MYQDKEKKLSQVANKISSNLKGRSQFKYFFFLIYVFLGFLFFYGSYKINEKNIFYYPQYKLNQKFDVTSNVSMYLREVNYSEDSNKLYLSFEDRRTTENIQQRDSYPVTYRAKIIQGQLLNTVSYSTVSNGFIVEVQNVPKDFKTIKLSLVLNDFDQTDSYNRDQAPFFYVNNEESFRKEQNFVSSKNETKDLISLSEQFESSLIAVKKKEIENKQKKITELHEKISDYQQTKELPMNEKEERTVTQIDSQIEDLETQVQEAKDAIKHKEKKIKSYEDNISDTEKIKSTITKLRFTYDIEKEKAEK
ncbi:hypothetical protein [Enterococcus alishanensis]